MHHRVGTCPREDCRDGGLCGSRGSCLPHVKEGRCPCFLSRNQAGCAYVYLNYGMHWLLNFLVKEGSEDGFVLVRALEPLEGLDLMRRRRKQTRTELLCNGPAKLTQALGIRGHHHGGDPVDQKDWHLKSSMCGSGFSVEVSTRIGITQAVDYPWRFMMKGSRFVSISP